MSRMRITKVYTKAGDGGMTRLVGGQKVRKGDLRLESYGTVDELNAIVGIVRVEIARAQTPPKESNLLNARLEQIQNDLFNLGSDLATRIEDRWDGMRTMNEADVTRLEHEIDVMNEILEPLKEFILPGGGPVSAFLHQARTVCRRGERDTVRLTEVEEVNPHAVKYLNRLSDWFFVAGRWVAKAMAEPEFLWDRNR